MCLFNIDWNKNNNENKKNNKNKRNCLCVILLENSTKQTGVEWTSNSQYCLIYHLARVSFRLMQLCLTWICNIIFHWAVNINWKKTVFFLSNGRYSETFLNGLPFFEPQWKCKRVTWHFIPYISIKFCLHLRNCGTFLILTKKNLGRRLNVY